jgi:hypothetical protein
LSTGEKVAGGVKMTIHIHLVPRLRISGAKPSIPLIHLHGVYRENIAFFTFFIPLYQRSFLYRQKVPRAGFISYAQHNIHVCLSTDSHNGNSVLHNDFYVHYI